jgi:hypothetical protein
MAPPDGLLEVIDQSIEVRDERLRQRVRDEFAFERSRVSRNRARDGHQRQIARRPGHLKRAAQLRSVERERSRCPSNHLQLVHEAPARLRFRDRVLTAVSATVRLLPCAVLDGWNGVRDERKGPNGKWNRSKAFTFGRTEVANTPEHLVSANLVDVHRLSPCVTPMLPMFRARSASGSVFLHATRAITSSGQVGMEPKR